MLKLFIDNQPADLDRRSEISISIAAPLFDSSTTSLGRAAFSKSISIPATSRNARLMSGCDEPLAAVRYNHNYHTACVEMDGCIILQGEVRLASVTTEGGEPRYRFNIIGAAREWVREAAQPLRELFPEWSRTLSEEMIRNSWSEEDAPVRFFPVDYGYGRGNPLFFSRILTESYHPFLHIATLLESFFERAGYSLESEFMASEWFCSLYMSGRWSEQEFGGWAESMDFLATRSENSAEVECDVLGYVNADPLVGASSVGNHVELPDGEGGSFNNGALSLDSIGRLCFTPTKEIPVAFEHHFRLRTDTAIKDRRNLRGLTNLFFDAGDKVRIPIPNDYVDHRKGALSGGYKYTLVVFEPVEGATYTLRGDQPLYAADGTQTGTVVRQLVQTSTFPMTFSHSFAAPISSLRLTMVKDGLEMTPVSDWAVYGGEVRERGEALVEVTLRTAPRRRSPTNPHYFQQLGFGGGLDGMTLTLLKGCTTRPLLVPHPIDGDTIGWSNVADYDTTVLQLIVALQELFDLQIYTDPTVRKVYIEPRSTYCDAEVVIDLSERVDLSRGVVIEEIGGSRESFEVAYRKGDRAVEALSEQEGREYGSMEVAMANVHADRGTTMVRNSLFAASVSDVGAFSEAPSAEIVSAGDSESPHRAIGYRNFTPKIVAYRGLRKLPDGEQWMGLYDSSESYPFITFFDDGSSSGLEPLSLLFEQRGGVEGVGNRYWRSRVDILNHSRRLTLHLHLRPEEVEQLISPNSSKHDFRAHYLLRIAGEKVLCRLEEIVDYNPLHPTTRAVFVTVG